MTSPLRSLPPERLSTLVRTLDAEAARRLAENRLKNYRPYTKQSDFHASHARERLLIAGNQLGKTTAGAAEVAAHLTGQYPEWWTGRRYERPITAIVGSESAELTREGVQRLLLGPPADASAIGTGLIPKASIGTIRARAGVANAVDVVTIANKSGGESTLLLKSYDQGRGKWQASTADFVWLDEEPPLEIYSEALTRTNAVADGALILTFTPLKGASDVVRRFLTPDAGDAGAANRAVITLTIDDAAHISPERRAEIVASYPLHEREARTRGIPVLGSGRVFPVAEDAIAVPAFDVPAHWPQIVGVDFGWDHPFAAVRLAIDRDSDVVYVVSTYRQRETTAAVHAVAIKSWGGWQPIAWPHDGLQHEKSAGVALADQYRQHGLPLLPTRAQFADGSSYVEAGVMEMLERFESGRLKIFSHLTDFFDEFRQYHRKDGLIVKVNDDVISAIRYGIMMRRFAFARPSGGAKFATPRRVV